MNHGKNSVVSGQAKNNCETYKLLQCNFNTVTRKEGALIAQGKKRPIYEAFRKMTEYKTDLHLIHSLLQVQSVCTPPPPSLAALLPSVFPTFLIIIFYMFGILLPGDSTLSLWVALVSYSSELLYFVKQRLLRG